MSRGPLLFALAVLLVTAALSRWALPSAGSRETRVRARSVPLVIGAWRGTEEPVPARALAVLRSEDVILRRYRRGADSVVLAITASSGDRRVAHPPEVCLRAAGYEIVSREAVAVPGLPGGAIRLVARRGDDVEQVLYWYLVGGRSTASYLGHQLDAALGELFGRSPGAALVRVGTAREGEAARESVAAFAAAAAPVVREALFRVEIGGHRPAN